MSLKSSSLSCVLVVDDDVRVSSALRNELTTALRGDGDIEVYEASTDEEIQDAYNAIAEEGRDLRLAIVDLVNQNAGNDRRWGHRILTKLGEKYPMAVRVAFTSDADAADMHSLLDNGLIDDFENKVSNQGGTVHIESVVAKCRKLALGEIEGNVQSRPSYHRIFREYLDGLPKGMETKFSILNGRSVSGREILENADNANLLKQFVEGINAANAINMTGGIDTLVSNRS